MNMKTLKAATTETAAAVADAENRLLSARAGVEDAQARSSNLVRLLADLRAKVAAYVRDGRMDEASRLSIPIGETAAAVSGAEEIQSAVANNIEAAELALARAELAAELAFREAHQRAHDELRALLVADFDSRWRSAYQHSLKAGGSETFQTWANHVMHDGNVLVSGEHLGPVNYNGLPEYPPQSEAMDFVKRRALRAELYAG